MRLSARAEGATAIWQYCFPAFPDTPSTGATACNVPPVARLAVGPSVSAATDELLQGVWSATEWELYVDGRRVDLGAFETFDVSEGPRRHRRRGWHVLLETPSVGSHTLRTVLVRTKAVSDGSREMPVGRYEAVVNFTLGQ
jgi:hypothetical protein